MSVFNRRPLGGGLMDDIRCDEQEYLIWKWSPDGMTVGKTQKENAIRWGSSLRVKPGEVAAFFYGDDTRVDYIEGPFDEILKTGNLPVLSSILGLAYDGGTPFQAEVYFINLAKIIQTRFAVPYFDAFDARYPDVAVPLAVRGTLTYRIEDYRHFVTLHRLSTFAPDDFIKQIRDAVSRYTKEVVTNMLADCDLPLLQIERQISSINLKIAEKVTPRLFQDFGVKVASIDVGAIELDKASVGYSQLMSVTRDVTLATIQAEKEARVKQIREMQRTNMENYAETLRVNREEMQYGWHKRTQSENFPAYQVEAQTSVGVAGANALGDLGKSGSGSVNTAGDAGFSPVGLAAGMAVGSAVGQNIATAMNQSSFIQYPSQTPPSVPVDGYHIARDGLDAGFFSMTQLQQMARNGQLRPESLVWKPGMKNWEIARDRSDLSSLFEETPPPIPRV